MRQRELGLGGGTCQRWKGKDQGSWLGWGTKPDHQRDLCSFPVPWKFCWPSILLVLPTSFPTWSSNFKAFSSPSCTGKQREEESIIFSSLGGRGYKGRAGREREKKWSLLKWKPSQAHQRLCRRSSACLIGPRWWAAFRGFWQILMFHSLPLSPSHLGEDAHSRLKKLWAALGCLQTR